ncbi:MAG: magnesium transporter CorA family protein [Patescibacteria group bacterium]|nr:magnesium transporter CorA family protein [Patescibacteria group bacterium]
MPGYKKISKNIEEITIDNPKTLKEKLIWLNIGNAGKKESEFLRKKYNFDSKHLRASLAGSTAQRPMAELGKNYLFLILHFPVLVDGNICSGEIDFFIGHGYLVTLHDNNLGALDDFFDFCQKKESSLLAYKFESSAILLYELLEKLMLSCYGLLDQTSLAIAEAEKTIFAQKQKEAVSRILYLKRNIINLRKILQNHKNILKGLTEMKSSLVPEQEIKKHYYRLVENSKRIWEFLESQKEMIEALHDTNESLLNYRISDIMKTLTIFSVIVFPLTLLAAIFGMNTMNGMPFVETSNGFWVVIAIMLVGCLGMLAFFEKKRWL